MENVTRRGFLRFGLAAMAGTAAALTFPKMGRRLALAGPGSDFYTIAVISDTQNYVDGTRPQPFNKNIFLDQTRYLATHMREPKLSFVTRVGDMVEHGDGSSINLATDYRIPRNIEWLNAMEAMDMLDAAGTAFGVCIGNHDYDNYGAPEDIPLVCTPSCWEKHLGAGSKYFRGKP